ncbi:MAG: CoA transferase [Dehalococcoidia bacterium]
MRVLTFEAAVTLPSATRVMADLGADVVQVRRPRRVVGNFIAIYDGTMINKSAVSIDLRLPEGGELALRLAARADVVCNNFTPRVMRGFGLDYEALRAVKPELIVMQLTGYGTPGPWAEFPAYGPSVEAAGGMNSSIGDEGDVPVRIGSGVFADQLAGRYATVALLAALTHRQRTGEGQYIDLSMYEDIVHMLGPQVMAASRPTAGRASGGGGPPPRLGNRDPGRAPQGIYPSAGEDEWVAISVESDEQWAALRGLLGDPRLDSPALETLSGRIERHDAIDDAVAAWTRGRTKDEAAELLQRRGVAAGPVQAPGDLALDPHYAARGHYRTVRHRQTVAGADAHPHLSQLPKIHGASRAPLREPRADGEDNAPVLKRWLDLDGAEIRRLRRAGVLGDVRPLLQPGADVDRRGLYDPEHARKLRLSGPRDGA